MNDGGDKFGHGLASKEALADFGRRYGNQGVMHHGVGQRIDLVRRNHIVLITRENQQMSDLQKFAIEFPLIEFLKLIVSNEQMDLSIGVNLSDFEQSLIGVTGPGLMNFMIEGFEFWSFRTNGTDHLQALFSGKQRLFGAERGMKGGAEKEFVEFAGSQGFLDEHEVSVVQRIKTAPEKSDTDRMFVGSHPRVTRPGPPTFRIG
jgi:hypothetical protein